MWSPWAPCLLEPSSSPSSTWPSSQVRTPLQIHRRRWMDPRSLRSFQHAVRVNERHRVHACLSGSGRERQVERRNGTELCNLCDQGQAITVALALTGTKCSACNRQGVWWGSGLVRFTFTGIWRKRKFNQCVMIKNKIWAVRCVYVCVCMCVYVCVCVRVCETCARGHWTRGSTRHAF